jgi:hypothetical protein
MLLVSHLVNGIKAKGGVSMTCRALIKKLLDFNLPKMKGIRAKGVDS